MRRNVGMLFSPRILPLHALGIAATTIAVWLGLWQIDAWQAQRAAEAHDLTDLTPVALAEVLAADDPFPASAVGRPVSFEGAWLPEATFYVSGREHDGAEGVWAVTPVAVCGAGEPCDSAAAMLVVRGWANGPATAPAAPEGRAELTGWLQPPEGTGITDQDPSDDVIPEVRIADAIQRVEQDLYGAFLVAEQVSPAAAVQGLEPVTPASMPSPPSDTGLRNLLYGIQWFVFAVFAIFIWWRWVRDEVERARRADEVAAEEAVESAEVPSNP